MEELPSESGIDAPPPPRKRAPQSWGKWALALLARVAILLAILAGSTLVNIDSRAETYYRTRSHTCLQCNRHRLQKFYVSDLTGRICYSQRETSPTTPPSEIQRELGWGDRPHEHVWAHSSSDGHRGFLWPRSSGLHGRGPWAGFPQSLEDIATSVRTIAARDPEMARRIAQNILINPTRFWLSWFPEPEQAARERDQEEFHMLMSYVESSSPLEEGKRRKFNRLLDEYSGCFIEN